MAVNYSQLFTGLGELVQRVNEYQAFYTTFATGLSEIEADFNTIGRGDIFSGIPEIFQTFDGNVLSWIGQLNAKASALLTERESILEELHLSGTDVQGVLQEMFRDMQGGGVSIKANTVTIGSITDDKLNSGAGGLMVDKTLDGVSAPHSGFSAIWQYNGLDSELTDSEAMFVQCTGDSDSDGQREGSESFQIFGQVSNGDRYSSDTFGSGTGPSLQPIQGATLLTNTEMEGFTADIPDGWTLDAGVAATNVTNSTSVFHRGVESLKLIGDSSTASIQLSQTITAGLFLPRKRYVVGFWIRGTGGISSGTLTIQFEGTGYTAGSNEKISLNAATLTTMGAAFSWQYFYVNMPDEIPDDMELVIKWTGTPSTHSVYIDGGGVAAPTWHNGLNFMMYAGSEQFIRNDRFTFSVVQNSAGVFQSWLRKTYGVQLPSSGSPSISDSLAT